ncbi:hypothetical protein GAYE_PCTG69G1423 [Galdieria yellowstonensis]|uniref:phosphoglucomutase (alpha-D-glucose-1,6-bisphosphate-dependent) n=1 Tax=Galdieria yellowstonensis TaxID=3028027 RepID=A0AAV9I855_9RHOD|nr:hypothetical protein GAYE_PCTG69G1423 [Galdieria yellowstonensis]
MFRIVSFPTTPSKDQKPGTSGLRKKVETFRKQQYLVNFVQSIFDSLPDIQGKTLVLGGDGRFYNSKAIRIIARMAAANGVGKLLIGKDGLLSTPAVSAIIRQRKLYGGIILTASHNPGGADEDFGIKYNVSNGGPALENLTSMFYENSQRISSYKLAMHVDFPDQEDPFEHTLSRIDQQGLSDVYTCQDTGNTFEMEIISSVDDYLHLMKQLFDFSQLKQFTSRSDFRMLLDSMNGVTGIYTRRIFVEELGLPKEYLMRDIPKEDFGGHHPDPNLVYAHDLVELCDPNKNKQAVPNFAAAFDGDGDRCMILGTGFFVSPADSLAVITANADCIPHFRAQKLKGVARSMPTAAAVDFVAEKRNMTCYETPTGWKFFGNLMDADLAQICGEESFGLGSNHIREKDGIFTALCWLSILASKNEQQPIGKLISVEDIVKKHWETFGRNFFSRYDYDHCKAPAVSKLLQHIKEIQTEAMKQKGGQLLDYPVKLKVADSFTYIDPVDHSKTENQGYRFVFEDNSRFVLRLSGTSSSDATVRMYFERYSKDVALTSQPVEQVLRPVIDIALKSLQISQILGKTQPDVIT